MFVSLQVCATLGTTGVCAFDNLAELGPVCKFVAAVTCWCEFGISIKCICVFAYTELMCIIFLGQVQRKDCGFTLMLPMLALRSSAQSLGHCLMEWTMLTLLLSIHLSGWWFILIALLSGEFNGLSQCKVKNQDMSCFFLLAF